MSAITLERAQDRLNKLMEMVKLREYFEKEAALETLRKVHGLHDELGELPAVPSVFRSFPKFPAGEEEMKAAEQAMSKKKMILLPLVAVTAISYLIFLLFHAYFFSTLTTIGLLPTGLFAYQYFSRKSDYDKLKKKYEETVSTYNKTMGAFQAALNCYEEEKAAGLVAAQEYSARYQAAYGTYEGLLAEFGANKEVAEQKYLAIGEEVYADQDFAKDYDSYLYQIVNFMRSGRAETYADALNLAISEERAERAEQERRKEEARRTAMMAEQAAEARRHNEAMERQAEMQNKIAQDDARRAAAAEKERQYVPGVGYRDKYGNYYDHKGIPIPPPGSQK